MAMGKIVLGSSVAAIAEIIKDGFNGMLFEKSNIEDLTTKLEILIQDKSLRKKIGHNARRWVEKERDWKVLSKKLIDIYNK
jgi:glycosyltransferase involved in cell wall biosynthesis